MPQSEAESLNAEPQTLNSKPQTLKVLVVDDDNGQRMVTPPGTLNLALKLKP